MDNVIPEPITRDFSDTSSARSAIYNNVATAYTKLYPIENDQYKLELTDVAYDDKEPNFSIAKQKAAILSGRTLQRPLYGTWRLIDKANDSVVDERPRTVVAKVPHLTDRGTFIFRGNEYTLASQMRLRPGVYTRRKETGEVESHFNILPGSGPSFRMFVEPDTGIFNLKIGGSKFPLYPLLKATGVSDKQLEAAWGRDLLAVNRGKDAPKFLHKAFEKFTNKSAHGLSDTDVLNGITVAFEKMRLDPDVTTQTLGKAYNSMNPEVLTATSQKLLSAFRGGEDIDDRDNIAFQRFMGPEDLFAERVYRDADGVNKNTLWKSTWKRNLDPTTNHNTRSKQLYSVLLNSGLGQALEETNPIDVADQLYRVSRVGAGGIPTTDAIPEESQAVQPSYLSFIDPVRTAESEKAGVDNRLSYGVKKGADGLLYSPIKTKSGNTRLLPSSQVTNLTLAFPGEMEKAAKTGDKVRALVKGKMRLVDLAQVDGEIPSHESMLSPPGHMVPFVSALKGHRMMMAGKMFKQALALRDAESPFVQTARINDKDPEDTFEKYFGEYVGAKRANEDAVIEKVKADEITLRTKSGEKKTIELYDNFPFNRRSFITNTPTVTPGQVVKSGDLLATSNFTDKGGITAIGKNFRFGLLPYKGLTFEDAFVVSEGAAKRLTSEHMYQNTVDLEPDTKVSRNAFVSKYPAIYTKEKLSSFDDNGVIKPGTTVQPGDPLILSISKASAKGQGILTKLKKDSWINTTKIWDHDVEGVVTDVDVGPKSINVVVKSYHPSVVGDKLANRHGGKGVISAIIPDDRMPRDSEGNPLEILMHPFGIVSRTNPSSMFEAALGKIAAKTGKPYVIKGFSDDSYVDFVENELKKHGMSDTEDLFDPERNAKIPNVFVGNAFLMKLQHTAEGKLAGRGEGAGYTADKIPAKAGDEASKRIGLMEISSLLSAGATDVLKDIKLVRGQKNDEFWRAFRQGFPPPSPKVPFVYNKFFDSLKAAGINTKKKGNTIHLLAMTDKDVDAISRGEIKNADTFDFDKMSPVTGGMFDLGLTGGAEGQGWSHIKLDEPVPNPAFEEPIRRILKLTKNEFIQVLAGKKDINGLTGGTAIQEALKNLNVNKQIAVDEELVKTGSRSSRDDAIKRLRYLHTFGKTGIKPEELVLTKVPVLPPQYRPISNINSKLQVVSHPNSLYKELFEANSNLRDVKTEIGKDSAGDERVALYNSFSALVGLSDPLQPKLQQTNVRGILSHLVGIGYSPKFSDFQKKLLGTGVDMVGRAVITPNPSLDMDQVGLPEDAAWNLYRPFVIRGLIKMGMPATQAVRALVNRDDRAKKILESEMTKRPVIINRAPTLHRYGIMAAWPILTKNKTLEVPAVTCSGFGADFDGDAEQFHVPVSESAVREATEKLLPSRNLTSVSKFDVHYTPKIEFLHGIFEATSDASKRPTRTFKTKKDVIAAYRRGEIDIKDRVTIVE